MYIYTVHYCCEIKYHTNRYNTDSIQTKLFKTKKQKSSKIPTEYPLLPGWEIADLTRLHMKENCFSIYTKDILHHLHCCWWLQLKQLFKKFACALL